jgi:triacylglycerol lipase
MKIVKIVFTALLLFSATTAIFAGGGGSTPLAGSYPIVLSHGILGFDDSSGPMGNLLQYWGGLDDYLRNQGADVLTPASTAMASIDTRSGQQKAKIQQWLSSIGKSGSKIHVIAHSQGGLVTRYMVTNDGMAGQVSSLTTVNTPHRGTAAADIFLGVIPNWALPFVTSLINWFGGLFYSDNQQDILAMGTSLTVATANGFNSATPNMSGVNYWSVGSYMWVNLFQHPIMNLTCPIMVVGSPFYGHSTYNDGIVSTTSQKWGSWKGYPSEYFLTAGLDHLQMTNFEWTGEGRFDVEGFYLEMAERAKNGQ